MCSESDPEMELISGQVYQRPDNQQQVFQVRGRILSEFGVDAVVEKKRISDISNTRISNLISDFYIDDFESRTTLDVFPEDIAEFRAISYAAAGIIEYFSVDVLTRRIIAFRFPENNSYNERKIYQESDTFFPVFFASGVHGVKVRNILPSAAVYVKLEDR